MSYAAAKDCVRRYHRSSGDVSIIRNRIATLRHSAKSKPTKDAIQDRNNAEVLTTYLDRFATPFRTSLPNGAKPKTLNWVYDGLRVTGTPHLAVVNNRRVTKYLYLITAKDWTDRQKKFFTSLLSDIVANNYSDTVPKDVECLDCRSGTKIKRNGLSINGLRRVRYLARELSRLGIGNRAA